MRKTLAAVGVLAATLSLPSHAEYLYGFGDVSLNWLDWSNGTTERSGGNKQDFLYLELEGGAGFTWGEIYGFADLENLDKSSDNYATSVKGSIGYKVGLEELRLYAQYYNTNSAGFTSQNVVGGVSYAFSGSNWAFNPFIGFNYATGTNIFDGQSFSGFNGGMLGWNAMYHFNLGEANFSLTNWHETEFARDETYLATIGGTETDDLSYNGALAFWWHATQDVSAGIQYRYAHNKLGQPTTDNAIIYTVKYNF
jgi:nucleoside-specific outer membrane channel protein Tsx